MIIFRRCVMALICCLPFYLLIGFNQSHANECDQAQTQSRYFKACEQLVLSKKNPRDQHNLGNLYIQKGQILNALRCFTESAKQAYAPSAKRIAETLLEYPNINKSADIISYSWYLYYHRLSNTQPDHSVYDELAPWKKEMAAALINDYIKGQFSEAGVPQMFKTIEQFLDPEFGTQYQILP